MLFLWLSGIGSSLALAIAYRWIAEARFQLDQPGQWMNLSTRVERLLLLLLLLKVVLLSSVGYPTLLRWFQMQEMAIMAGVAGLLVQQLLEAGLIFRWLYPLEHYIRSLTLSRREYVLFRCGLILESLAPILIGLCGLLIVRFLWVNQGQPSAGSLDFLVMAGFVFLATTFFLWRRRFLLPVRTHSIPFAGTQAEIERLGREIGVSVREVLVLDGTRHRMANAFAVGSDRLAISDYLMAHLTEREILAVLAHEIMHLAQRGRFLRLWLIELIAGVLLSLLLTPFLRHWGWEYQLLLLLLPLFWIALVPMVQLRRRHERDADAFAASQYGPETLQSALLKVAELNGKTLTEGGRHRVHPSFAERIAALDQWFRAGL